MQEDDLLLEGHRKYGNKWTEIAKLVGGRTDNAVKNRWHAICKKHERTRPDRSRHAERFNDHSLFSVQRFIQKDVPQRYRHTPSARMPSPTRRDRLSYQASHVRAGSPLPHPGAQGNGQQQRQRSQQSAGCSHKCVSSPGHDA